MDEKLEKIGTWDGATLTYESEGSYEDALQQEVAFGANSFFHAPWKSYMDTWPADKWLNELGVVYNGTPDEADAVMQVLSEAGIKMVRIEWGWNHFQFEDDSKLLDFKVPEWNKMFDAMKRHGIRPIILLNANAGQPGPVKSVDAQVAQNAPKGAREVYLSDVSGITPGYTGFDGLPGAAMTAYPLIVQTDAATGKVTLSAPLPGDLPAGSVRLVTLKYRPIGADTHPDGTPDLDTLKTLEGWKKYVKSVSDFAKMKLGTETDAGFDLEVWNEYTFGSEFLDLNHYYDPDFVYPKPRIHYEKFGKQLDPGHEVLLPLTVD